MHLQVVEKLIRKGELETVRLTQGQMARLFWQAKSTKKRKTCFDSFMRRISI